MKIRKEKQKKIIEDSKKKLDKDIENKKQKFDDEIKKELTIIEKEISSLKKYSASTVNKIAAETSTEIIKQIIDTEVNNSNVSAIVDDLAKKKMEKYI